MLTWIRNRWPDPRIGEMELEIDRLVKLNETTSKNWKRAIDEKWEAEKRYNVLLTTPPEARVVEKIVPVERIVDRVVEKIVEKPVVVEKAVTVEKIVYRYSDELKEENRVLKKKLEMALGRLHGWDHNQAISIEKMKNL